MAWSKESRHKRGYGTAWDKIRERILKRDEGMCQCTDCKGIKRSANEVDHIVSKAKAKRLGWSQARIDAESNLQAINHDCHIKKSAEEQGQALKPKVKIGLDGWPIRQ
jgi:5-methylcytosine-specific restriction protein A